MRRIILGLVLLAACGDDSGGGPAQRTAADARRLPCIEDTVDIFLVAGGPVGSTVPSFGTPQAAADDAAVTKDATAVLIGEESDDVRFALVTPDGDVIEEVVVGHQPAGWQVKSHETCPDD